MTINKLNLQTTLLYKRQKHRPAINSTVLRYPHKTSTLRSNRNILLRQDNTLKSAEIINFWQSQSVDNQCLFFCQNVTSFTGKEKDSETGFYYFGARYYDPNLSGLFLSVDPMADKYPSISPYAYCAWNPVKLVDPDGDSLKLVGDEKYYAKAIEQMEKQTNNLSFYVNNRGIVLFNGEAKTESEKYMINILSDPEVIVNLSVQGNNYIPKKINNKYGTAFMGNEIRDNGIVDAFQSINVNLSEKYDKLCKNPGNMIWHEISEAYEGGHISLLYNTNAGVAYTNETNHIYETAHNKAGYYFPGNITSDHFMTYWHINKSSNPPEYKQVELRTNYRYEK